MRHPRNDSCDEAAIERALAELEGESASDPLRVASALRRRLTPRLAREAAELFELRRRASSRFSNASGMWLTRKGLEQATRESVARARAARISALAPGASVYDSTCGIGSDSMALSSSGMRLVAGDLDPRLARCARANLARAGCPSAVIVADARRPPVATDFVLLDPDRRADGERSLAPERWSPTLAASLEVAARFRGACLKLPPALDWRHIASLLPPRAPRHFQWVSSARELCELTLWLGDLEGGEATEREAQVVAPGGTDPSPARLSGIPCDVASLAPPEVAGIRWLCEPDPAVVRSGLVGLLASQLGLRPVAPGIAYLAAQERPRSPFLASWRVIASSSADPRRVRAMLAAHDVGHISVMKRGHPDRAEVLERRFRGAGSKRGLLALARLERGHVAWLLEPRTEVEAGTAARLPDRPPLDVGEVPEVGDEGLEPPPSSV